MNHQNQTLTRKPINKEKEILKVKVTHICTEYYEYVFEIEGNIYGFYVEGWEYQIQWYIWEVIHMMACLKKILEIILEKQNIQVEGYYVSEFNGIPV